jgi:hypothetical protein
MSDNSESEHDHSDIIVVLNYIFLFVGVLGNIAVIIHNIFLNYDKTPSSWLVTHLALADLLVCLILYPTKLVQLLHEEMRGKELAFCKIEHATFYVSLFLSIMILLSITIDKYLYIAKPLKYPLIVRTRRTRILLSCIWLAALVQFPLIYNYTMYISQECDGEKCYLSTTRLPTTRLSTIKQECEREKCVLPPPVVWLQVILQLAAICVMTILNYKMFKIAKDQRQRMASELVLQPQLQSEQVQSEQVQSEQVQSEQVQSEQVQSEQVQSEQVQSEQVQSEQVQSEQVQSEQVQSEQVQSEQVQSEQVQSEKNMTWLRHLAKELKAMKTFAIIVGVLTFCFVPYIVTNIIRVLDDDSCVLHTTYLIILHLVGVNSIANAFIYALKHKKYIRAYRKLLSSAWARLFPQNN